MTKSDCGRTPRAAISVFLSLLVCQSLAAENKPTSITEARAAIEANLRTVEGKKYDEEMGSDFVRKHMGPLRQCKQNGAPLESFWILMKLDNNGTAKEILLHPEAKLGVCAREGLLKEKFLAPPHPDYWIGVYLQLNH